MMKHIVAACLVLAFAGAGSAMADDDCHVPMNQWQPREAVQKMAQASGWAVSRITIDDGCYRVAGIDKEGQAFKARIDPATLATINMKYKRQDEDSDKKLSGRQRGDPGTGGALPTNELFKTGQSPTIGVR